MMYPKGTRRQQEFVTGFLAHFKSALHSQDVTVPREIAFVLTYIHRSLFDPTLSFRGLQEAVGVGDNNLSSRFKLHVGIGVRNYIEACRLKAATDLMRYRQLDISVISFTVGYEYPETFTRAFKRHFGLSPTKYRYEKFMRDDEFST